jgi:hypothetical protein
VSDLLFRGRGADVGVRAPAWRVRLAGALLGLFLMELLWSLGGLSLLGVGGLTTRAVFLLGGALLATSAWGAWLWTATVGVVLVHGVVAYTPLASTLFQQFVRRDAPLAGAPPDAVVVFSGTVTPEGRVMGQALERLLSGVSEAKRRAIPTLALSVVGNERDASIPNSERDQRELVGAFAPELQLKFVYNVQSSRDEALAFTARRPRTPAAPVPPSSTRGWPWSACQPFPAAMLPRGWRAPATAAPPSARSSMKRRPPCSTARGAGCSLGVPAPARLMRGDSPHRPRRIL